MSSSTTTTETLFVQIIEGVDSLVKEADEQTKPIEVDPYRRRLFEFFVTANGAGYLEEDTDVDLSADGLCRELSRRWGLADAARESVSGQLKLPPEHLSKMRLLWSLMRMWMEWDYAWQRWSEFNAE
ncbi:MAG: hypothetical protein O3A00_13150 [Planctomycetota bacterium]|nr:hypothetical protein [Planctomycetota bacterium]